MNAKTALIIGFGPGISLAFGKKLTEAGFKVAVASRNMEKLEPLASTIGAHPFVCDCSDADSIVHLFQKVDSAIGTALDVVLYNASSGLCTSGDVGSIDYSLVSRDMQISAIGAFVAAQEAGKRMKERGSGAIFLTGATAGIKAYPKRSSFAMGKFALRGMAMSMYKELSPAGIHVCHFIIDGGVRPNGGEGDFTPDAIATSYMLTLAQPKGAWSWEVELRAKDEKF